jgi:hypothetical protein
MSWDWSSIGTEVHIDHSEKNQFTLKVSRSLDSMGQDIFGEFGAVQAYQNLLEHFASFNMSLLEEAFFPTVQSYSFAFSEFTACCYLNLGIS